MADTVNVTQADHDATKDLLRTILEDMCGACVEECDYGAFLNAFARHRLASTQPAPALPREEVEKLRRQLDDHSTALVNLSAYAAGLRAALEAILDLETQPIHVGYDHGAGGGNYVYEDFVSADAAFGLARATLLQGKQP